MIRLFVIQQTLAVFLLTSFLSIKTYIFAQVFWCFIFLLCFFYTQKKQYLRCILVSFWWLILGITSTMISFTIKNSTTEVLDNDEQTEFEWTVVAKRKDNTYVVENENWVFFLRNTNKELYFGSKIFVKWQMLTRACDVCKNVFLQKWVESPTFWEFNYDLWRWNNWIVWDVYWKEVLILESGDWLWFRFKNHLLSKLHNWFDSAHVKWLFSWMLIGDISQLNKQNYEIFISSWLVHLVAVSGWNIVFLVLICLYWFFWLPFYIRYICLIGCVIVYGIIVWLDSSVFRALIMWIIVLSGSILGRKVSLLRSLMIWWSVLLSIHPYNLLYDLWLLLSFMAIVWIFIMWRFYKSFTKSTTIYKGIDYLMWLIVPTIWAFLGTFPILFFYIWKINILNIFWNILVIPSVFPVMILGFLTIILPQSSTLVHISWWVLNYIYILANFFSEHWIYMESELITIRSVISSSSIIVLLSVHYFTSLINSK